MWYFGEKGPFCNSLDPVPLRTHFVVQLLFSVAEPTWCTLNAFSGWDDAYLVLLRSSALISASLLLDLEFQEGELEGGWSETEKPTTQMFQVGSYQAWVELQVGDSDSGNEGVIAGNMKSVREYEAKGKKELD